MNDRNDTSGWLYYFEIDFGQPPEGEWTACVSTVAAGASGASGASSSNASKYGPLNRVRFDQRLFEFWQRENGNSRRLNANGGICFLSRGNFTVAGSKKKVLHVGDLVVLDPKRGGGAAGYYNNYSNRDNMPISRHRVGEIVEIKRGEDRGGRKGFFGGRVFFLTRLTSLGPRFSV